MNKCECELRNRKWNGGGRCLSCGRRYDEPSFRPADLGMMFQFDSEGYPDSCAIPSTVAACPCCGSQLVAEFEEWTADDKQPAWGSARVDCSRPECYDEYKDSEYWRMPYVYWLPVEVTCQQWMKEQWQKEQTNDK